MRRINRIKLRFLTDWEDEIIDFASKKGGIEKFLRKLEKTNIMEDLL